MRNKAFALTVIMFAFSFSADFVFASEFCDNLGMYSCPNGQIQCDSISDQDTQFCGGDRVGFKRHYSCIAIPGGGGSKCCYKMDNPIVDVNCQDKLTCSSDKMSVNKQKQKCAVTGTDPDTGKNVVGCVDDGASVSEKNCEGAGTECINNDTTVRSYFEQCLDWGSGASCWRYYKGQLPNPLIPADENCLAKNYGTCTNNDGHWQNFTYKCGTNLTTPKPACVLDKLDSGDCSQGKVECDSQRPYERKIYDNQICKLTKSSPPNSAFCDPPTPQSRYESCGTTGVCFGQNPTYAQTYLNECRSGGPGGAFCVRSNTQDPSKPQQACRADSRQCTSLTVDGVFHPASQFIRGQICKDNNLSQEPLTGTYASCQEPAGQNPDPDDCFVNQYSCATVTGNPSDPPLVVQRLGGFCNQNTHLCDTGLLTLETCDNARVKVESPYCSSTGIMQKWGNRQCVLIDSTVRPQCAVANVHEEIEQDCPTQCTTGYICDGSVVKPKNVCAGCRDQGGGASCDSWTEIGPGIDCAPENTSTTAWCTPGSGSVRCTMTARYPGKCIDGGVGNAECAPPTVEVVCEGPCTDSDGDGISDDVDPCPNDPNNSCQPPCTKTCEDGSIVGCTDSCPPCVTNCGVCEKNCPDGSKIPCDKDCDLPCPPQTCPDGSVVGCKDSCPPCEKICPNGQKIACDTNCPEDPLCIEFCPDGNPVPCGAECPPCEIDCGEGKTAICGEGCPTPPPSGANHCNEYKKCVAGNGEISCSKQEDCEFSCDSSYKCVRGGGGSICEETGDCLFKKPKCVLNNGVKQCRPDNCGGEDCENNADCQNLPTYCDSTCQKCVPGGKNANGDFGAPCQSDLECKYGCANINNNWQCVFGGAGGICNPYGNECQIQESRCNADRQCVADDCGGIACRQNEDCNQPAYCDSKCQRCVPGGDTGVICQFDSQCQIINDPPKATNLTAIDNYCNGIIIFQWNYYDKENDKQTNFWLEIDDNSNFSSPEVLRTGVDVNKQIVLLQTAITKQCLVSDYNQGKCTPIGNINYNKTYFWRVKVKEITGLESVWTSGAPHEYAYKHPAPISFFESDKDSVAVGGTVNFYNKSTCYNDSFGYADCKNYSWLFGDNTGSTDTNTSHAYKSKGSYAVSLLACDETACCYPFEKIIPVKASGPLDLPSWKEISPFR